MKISRRKFVKAGIVVAAFAGIPLKAQLASGREAGMDHETIWSGSDHAPLLDQSDILDYYNKSTFAPYVNTEFNVHLKSSKVRTLKLVEVKDYFDSPARATADASSGERFSLFFVSPHGKTFRQTTYEVEHAALGRFSLFIVPVGMRKGADERFEAVFNRRHQYQV